MKQAPVILSTRSRIAALRVHLSSSVVRSVLPALALLVVFSTSAGGDLVEQGPADSAPSGLLTGISRADITPPVGIAHMNWGSQTHIQAVGIDPTGMIATALVLSNGKQKFAMVDVDRLFVQGLEPAIERASRLTGIPAKHIRLTATHTHAGAMVSATKGPGGVDLSGQVEMIARQREQIIDKIVGAIVEANAKLEPAHLHGGRGIGTININRRFRARSSVLPAVGRSPDGFVDRELVVFRIDNAEGKPSLFWRTSSVTELSSPTKTNSFPRIGSA